MERHILELGEEEQLRVVTEMSRRQAIEQGVLRLDELSEGGDDVDIEVDVHRNRPASFYNQVGNPHIMSNEDKDIRDQEMRKKLDIGLVELTEDSPRAKHPKLISGILGPHQLAALYEMKKRERNEIEFTYGIRKAKLKSNVGILGDVPGHGKTRTILALIASDYSKKKKDNKNGLNKRIFYKSVDVGDVGCLQVEEPISMIPLRGKTENQLALLTRDEDPMSDCDLCTLGRGYKCNEHKDRYLAINKDPNCRNCRYGQLACFKHTRTLLGLDECIACNRLNRDNNDNDEDDVFILCPTHKKEEEERLLQRDKKEAINKKNSCLNMTLVVLPSKLIQHWKEEIDKSSKLKYYVVRNNHANFYDIEEQGYHIVICNMSTWKLCDTYTWLRIVVDEADNIKTVGWLSYAFMWFVTGSYDDLIRRRNQLPGNTLREINRNRELYNHLVVKSCKEFIESSNLKPPCHNYVIRCRSNKIIKAARELMGGDVAQLVASGDIKGAVEALGGKEGEADNIMELVTKKLRNKKDNLELLIKFTTDRHYESEEQRRIQLEKHNIDLEIITSQLRHAENTLKEIIEGDEFTCLICYDTIDDVTILPCAHGFCGPCILSWFNERNKNTCPICRAVINVKDITLANKAKICRECAPGKPCKRCIKRKKKEAKKVEKRKKISNISPTKTEALLRFCTEFNRILIFIKHTGGFDKLYETLSVTGKRIGMYTNNRTSVIKEFREGYIDILLLDPGTTAGIPIIEGEIAIIYHKMEEGLERQGAARIDRIGRKTPAVVIRLLYEDEEDHPRVNRRGEF